MCIRDSFYTTFDQVRGRKYDGMIITGAPVENLDFTQVEYWDELCEICLLYTSRCV